MSTDCSGIAPLISASTLGFSKSRSGQRGIRTRTRLRIKASNELSTLRTIRPQISSIPSSMLHSPTPLSFCALEEKDTTEFYSSSACFSDGFCSQVSVCPMPGATTSEVAWGGGRIPTASRGRRALKPRAPSCLQGGISTCLNP